jgi:hypothetical protein
MFSDEITTSDAFLDMPTESQLLYFHLGMNADDDGFIGNPKMIQRTIGASDDSFGASDDSFKILLAKKFLLQFIGGIVVVKHWRINNQIRKDRYRETKYTKEKATLFIRENGSYTFNPQNALPIPKGHFITGIERDKEDGNHLATSRQPSIGKVRLGKVRIDKNNTSEESLEKKSNIPVLIDLFKTVNPSYGKWFGNKTQRAACERMLKIYSIEKLEKVINFLPKSNKVKFCPVITTPLQLEDKFASLVAFWQKENVEEHPNI